MAQRSPSRSDRSRSRQKAKSYISPSPLGNLPPSPFTYDRNVNVAVRCVDSGEVIHLPWKVSALEAERIGELDIRDFFEVILVPPDDVGSEGFHWNEKLFAWVNDSPDE